MEELKNGLKQGKGEGRTIKSKKGRCLSCMSHRYKTKKLFNKPKEIRNRDTIASLLNVELKYPYYFYAPDFNTKTETDEEHQTETDRGRLAEKLHQKCGIADCYKDLQGKQDDMIKEIVGDLKDFQTKVLDKLEKLEKNQEKIMKTQQEIKNNQEESKNNQEEIKNNQEEIKNKQDEVKSMVKKTGDHISRKITNETSKVERAVVEAVREEVKNKKTEEKHSVVLLGDTGVGKSTVARYLAGTLDKVNTQNPFKVSHDEKVLTNEVHQFTETVLGGRLPEVEHVKLDIGDTPGLGDSAEHIQGNTMTDKEVIELIKQHIRKNCNWGVSAFLLVLDNNDEEINAESLKMYIDGFTAEVFVKNLIVVINHSELEKIEENKMLQLFKKRFLEIISDGRDLREGTKDQVEEIKAVHFDFGISDNGPNDPCLPKNPATQEILNQQLIKLVTLTKERGKSKYKC